MDSDSDYPKLKQELTRWQIFFIVCTAVIGGGIFNNDGEALEIAGPGGFLLALLIMGVITIMVMEGVSEFTQLFPAPNAIVEYVRAFVDEDLAWVTGIAYWYTYSATFAAQNLTAAHLSTYWGLSQTWQTVVFYFVAPAVITCINFAGVELYGWIESIFGLLKICLVFGTAIVMYVIAARENNGSPSGPINEGFKANERFASNHSVAVAYVIPLLAYSFLGVETVAITAFEAKRSKDLRLPSQIIAYVIFVLYVMLGIGEALDVDWRNDHLPTVYNGIGNNTEITPLSAPPRSSSMPIIASWEAGYKVFAGALNAFLIFSVLSAANTSLYMASRTLYGIARDIPDTNIVGKYLHKLSIVVPKTRVPAAALCISAVVFFWLPFVQLKGGYAITALIEIMAVSASISCLMVWATLSLAFIRYEWWLRACKNDLKHGRPDWVRNTLNYEAFTLFAWAQPWPAYVGLAGCLMVFVFASATWWSTPASFSKVAVAYAALVILAVLFLLFKAINGFRGYVKLEKRYARLLETLKRLKWYKRDEVPRPDNEELRNLEAEPLPVLREGQRVVYEIPGPALVRAPP